MLFNSIEFAIFLPIVFVLYWFVFNSSIRKQNLLLIVASYIFYGWWDWRFLSLIAFSSFIDYAAGKRLVKTGNEIHDSKRKRWLALSLGCNLGLLGIFKYFNFFVDNLQHAFTLFGVALELPSLHVILPVGISFYTFQTLSYSIDIYRGNMKPTEDMPAFFAFVSFFPQLVAGPIERAKDLLPQFYRNRLFNYELAVDGLRQMLWGFFKKIVVADQCGIFVNEIYANHQMHTGSTILLGTVFFAFQIYGDFSGYSDIAIGLSRLFGFKLTRNFAFPYFSRDIAEFWRRWHISLSSWFRDYVYIPLGGSKGSTLSRTTNTFIVFVVSGFWHGANWTFIVWGALNAVYFLPLMLTNNNRKHLDTVAENRRLPSLKESAQMLVTFSLVTLSWVFFRSQDVWQAFDCLGKIFSAQLFAWPTIWPQRPLRAIAALVIIEWIQRDKQHALENLSFNVVLRWLLYLTIIIMCLSYFSFNAAFIYFQF